MMADRRSTLVLRTSTGLIIVTAILAMAIGMGGIVGGLALAWNGWWTFASIAALGGLLILVAFVFSVGLRFTIDEDGVEKRSFVRKPIRLEWVEVTSIKVNGSITLIGSMPGVKLKIPSGIKGFAEFLDRLEDRLEYEHWLRAAMDNEPDTADIEGGVFRKKGWLRSWMLLTVILWIVAIGFALRSEIFAGCHLVGHGRDALFAFLFNLLFVDHPILGIFTLSCVALGSTLYVTKSWHTFRVEQDGLEFDSLSGVRSILYEQIAGLEYKIGRVEHHGHIQATKPTLRLLLDGGETLSLFGGKTGIRAKDAIEDALASYMGEPEA
jgi:hypothetical protein